MKIAVVINKRKIHALKKKIKSEKYISSALEQLAYEISLAFYH